MDKLLSGPDPEGPYNFPAVRTWCDRVTGDMGALEKLRIQVNANGNNWNFVTVSIGSKSIELWNSVGLRASKAKYRRATERFVKEIISWPGILQKEE